MHMNVDGNYSWLVDHTDDLANFLTDVENRDDVAEMVILGDLVDQWVAPVKTRPTLRRCAGGQQQCGDRGRLTKALCQSEPQSYLCGGNHDMLSFEEQNKETLTTAFPGLQVISKSPGMGAYTRTKSSGPSTAIAIRCSMRPTHGATPAATSLWDILSPGWQLPNPPDPDR